MDIQIFKHNGSDVAVRENGATIEFEAEAIARGLGFTTVAKSGNATVRWSRVNEYLSSFGYTQQMGKGDFIPESYVYLLGMKANNDVAVSFQKFIAFDVLPAIRKNKVYIDPSATDEEIDNAVRFATPQKRRKILMEATIDGKDSVFNVYEDIKEYISKWTADEKITALEHVERVLKDKQMTYGDDVAFIHKIEQLLLGVAKDLDKLANWKNGAIKRQLTRQNRELKEQVEYLNPNLEDMYTVNIHAFSENYMYDTISFAGEMTTKVKSKSYIKWIEQFPFGELPRLFDLDVDFNKPVQLIIYFDHLSKFDVINLDKSFADVLAYHYDFDDNVIVSSVQQTNRYVDSFQDGKIYFLLRNI